MNVARVLPVAIFLMMFVSHVFGQTDSGTPQNATAWYGFEGYHPFHEGKPWGIMLEGYVKRNDIVKNELSLFFRGGLNYELRNGNRITGGYAFQYNYPYDEASELYNWPDHRIWEQYLWRRIITADSRRMLMQRFRMEQRWLGRKSEPAFDEISDWKFENTFRYMLRLNTPVARNISLAFYDEIHFRLPPPDGEKLLDQNRIYGGMIFYLDERRLWRLETGYMFQSTFNAADEVSGRKRINHTLRITITSDAFLSAKEP